MLSVTYLDPTVRSFDRSVLGWLLEEIPNAHRVHVASGYFESSVLDWLEQPLESLVERGGTAHFLLGSNGGQTRRVDLARLLAITDKSAESTLFVEYAEGGLFHPKIYAVESNDAVKALVGSANFTGNGSLINVEAGLVVATDQVGPPPEAPLADILRSLDPSSNPNAIKIGSEDDLDHLIEIGVIGRVLHRQAADVTASRAATQRGTRLEAGLGARSIVDGVPARTRRNLPARQPPARPPSPTPATPSASAPAPTPSAATTYCALLFSSNDLKDTGTREISVSRGVREWAEGVLGRPIVPGEGTLFTVPIEGRLASSPAAISITPTAMRIWAAGGSGGTHTDIRLVLGSTLRAELDDEAVYTTGLPVLEQSIGVLELPADPATDPIRLTVFLPTDPDWYALYERLGRSGREQKLHFTAASVPELPTWP